MSSQHILLVSTSFPDVAYQAGQEAAGSFVADFVAALGELVRVTAVVPTIQPQPILEQEQNGNITIHRFPVPRLPLSLLKPTNPTHWPAIWHTLRAGQHAVQQIANNQQIDHILALWALPSGQWARQTGIPYTIWALGSDIWSLGKVPLVRQQLQTVLRHSAHCFADGYQLAEEVQMLSGRDCHFLPSSRQLTLSQPKQLATAPPYKLAFLGRWHPHKGVDLLLESLHLLTEADWARIAEVRLFGGGPLAELVQTEVAKLQKLGRPITLGGYLDRAGATALYEWADYLLLPSRIESIPVLFSDALQSLCPLISTPIGDLPRLMASGSVGLLATDVTPQAYASAIRQAVQRSPMSYQSGLLETASHFSLRSAVNQFLRQLETG
jgi:glycosyltransferase involved in cell wall biosynthesis